MMDVIWQFFISIGCSQVYPEFLHSCNWFFIRIWVHSFLVFGLFLGFYFNFFLIFCDIFLVFGRLVFWSFHSQIGGWLGWFDRSWFKLGENWVFRVFFLLLGLGLVSGWLADLFIFLIFRGCFFGVICEGFLVSRLLGGFSVDGFSLFGLFLQNFVGLLDFLKIGKSWISLVGVILVWFCSVFSAMVSGGFGLVLLWFSALFLHLVQYFSLSCFSFLSLLVSFHLLFVLVFLQFFNLFISR